MAWRRTRLRLHSLLQRHRIPQAGLVLTPQTVLCPKNCASPGAMLKQLGSEALPFNLFGVSPLWWRPFSQMSEATFFDRGRGAHFRWMFDDFPYRAGQKWRRSVEGILTKNPQMALSWIQRRPYFGNGLTDFAKNRPTSAMAGRMIVWEARLFNIRHPKVGRI